MAETNLWSVWPDLNMYRYLFLPVITLVTNGVHVTLYNLFKN